MNKRKFDIQKLSEVLNDFSNHRPIAKGLEVIKINELWKKVMGKNIDAYTNKVKFEKDVLYVKINSASLREELSFEKNKIIKLLNNESNTSEIKKIIFH
tara:strand:+ start:8224 stop:8520 length:297 start_codon:yes stop_codon:yes gene_type:complete